MLARDNALKSRTKLDINEIRKMINLCLANCYFKWENEICEQENSGSIGLALMVVIAEAFLQHHEAKAINIALNQNTSIKSFLRYVDDSHSRVECIENANPFLEILNDQSSHLQ